ncbi:hypothetical protein HF1_08230 [Mycoplasma haemofelis str. Langford 1]|uniref:Uncharacterized protein n=2 Tax=Mycoplasma haemofelis TaxID=29501 RepID=F6FIW2_MYCHI|nr:hypothetical protein [Mycoplasma haemofelis]AEG73160.1 hypothetical protein MHF_0902 [Mycoplasma haemofelis Ohio2]CBY92831.1 hypothetical protein HF1_08230 [Mycoplasma haemofelis str. Langford 1]
MSKIAAASTLGVGAAGAGGFGAYHFYFKESPSEDKSLRAKLISERYIPLELEGNKHQDHWTSSLSQYKSKHSDKNQWSEVELKNLCSGFFKKDEIIEKDYNEARKYCVVPRKISERLSDLSIKVLDTGETKDTDKWTKLSEEYKKSKTGFKKLHDLETSGIQSSDSTDKTLKDKCVAVFDMNHWTENYDSLLEASRIWCTESGFNSLPKEVK